MEQQIKSYANPATAKTDADILAADGWFVHSMISDTRPPQEKKGYSQQIIWHENADAHKIKMAGRHGKQGWHAHSITALSNHPPYSGIMGWYIIWHQWESCDNILVTYRKKG